MKEKTMERICDESFDCAEILLDAVMQYLSRHQDEDTAPGIPFRQGEDASTAEFLRTLPQIYTGLGETPPPAICKYAEKCSGAKAEFFAIWFSMWVADGIENLRDGQNAEGY